MTSRHQLRIDTDFWKPQAHFLSSSHVKQASQGAAPERNDSCVPTTPLSLSRQIRGMWRPLAIGQSSCTNMTPSDMQLGQAGPGDYNPVCEVLGLGVPRKSSLTQRSECPWEAMPGRKVGEPVCRLVSHWPPPGTNWFLMSLDLRSRVKCFSERATHPEGQSEESQPHASLTLGPSCWERSW